MSIANTKDDFIIGCLKAGHPIDNVKILWLAALRKGNYAIPPIYKETKSDKLKKSLSNIAQKPLSGSPEDSRKCIIRECQLPLPKGRGL